MRDARKVRRALALGTAIGALTLSVSLGGASAHTATLQNSLVFDTPVTSGPTTTYSGQVFGPSDCRKGRLVDIYVGGVLLTTATTDVNGRFSASGPKPAAGTEATAIARKKVKRTRRHKHKCPQKMETKKVSGQ
jgi:hypothetical protein